MSQKSTYWSYLFFILLYTYQMSELHEMTLYLLLLLTMSLKNLKFRAAFVFDPVVLALRMKLSDRDFFNCPLVSVSLWPASWSQQKNCALTALLPQNELALLGSRYLFLVLLMLS